MTAARLRIDLSQGLIEVEGSEGFILEIYGDFKEKLAQSSSTTTRAITQAVAAPSHPAGPANTPSIASGTRKPAQSTKAGPSVSAKKQKREPKFLGDLDLTLGKLGRLKDFYAQYAPKTNMENNLIFTYYFNEGQGIDEITEDHLMTAYRTVGVKIPKALRQSVLDTSSTRGWVDTDSSCAVRLTVSGRNHIEHDMVKSSLSE